MAELVCASCARNFTVRPQTPRQTFCPAPECQRERRLRWAKAKLTADPDYRANQLAAQRAWHARHPEYWQNYRRGKRAEPAPASSQPTRATSDASICGADPRTGRCWIEILTHGPGGTPQALRVEVKLTRTRACKHERVQTEDSWMWAAPPPNVPLHDFEIPVSVRRDA